MREIRLVLMVHTTLLRDLSNVEVGHKATGLGGVVGNKVRRVGGRAAPVVGRVVEGEPHSSTRLLLLMNACCVRAFLRACVRACGTQGAVAISLRLRDTALCFVSAHLAARPERVDERNSNFADVLQFLRRSRPTPVAGSRRASHPIYL